METLMVIKGLDGRRADIEALGALLEHPGADAQTRSAIERELGGLRGGARPERAAAYRIDFDFGASPNWAVIHDLRLEHDGRVAQIDHLLVNRSFDVWMFETTAFLGGLTIDEQGDCSTLDGLHRSSIPSPFEQGRWNAEVLLAALQKGAIALPRRFGRPLMPRLRPRVLVSARARIVWPSEQGRPDAEHAWSADQLRANVLREIGGPPSLWGMLRAVRADTVMRFAKRLAAAHRPAAADWASRFGLEPAAPLRGGTMSRLTGSEARDAQDEPSARRPVRRAVRRPDRADRFDDAILRCSHP